MSGLTPATPDSVIRFYVFQLDDVSSARKEFRDLGCESELSDVHRLFAISDPERVLLIPLQPLSRLVSVEGVGSLRSVFFDNPAKEKLGMAGS